MDPRGADHWEDDTRRPGMRVDSGRLWAGGAATAVVAAGAALVGVLVIRGIMDIPVLTPNEDEQLFSGAGVTLPIVSAFAALAATALLHLLVQSTPRPRKFFSWITGLVLAGLVLQVFLANSPFLASGEFLGVDELIEQLATAALYLVIGVAIISLLSGVARTAITRPAPPAMRRGDPRAGDPRGYDGHGYQRSDQRAQDGWTRHY